MTAFTSSVSTQPRFTLYTISTYFCHQHPSCNMVLMASLHVYKSCQWFLIHHSTRQHPFYSRFSTQLFIPNSIHSWHSRQTLKHLISRTFTYPMPQLSTTQLVQLLLQRDTSHISPISYITQHTFQHTKLFTAQSLCVPHLSTSSISCHMRPQVLKTIHFL